MKLVYAAFSPSVESWTKEGQPVVCRLKSFVGFPEELETRLAQRVLDRFRRRIR